MGWDCMRHYEILANRCIPSFPDLEKCPSTIMTNFPKNIILEISKYSLQEKIHLYYDQFSEYLLNYTKENLTTKKLVEIML
jgi:hypothetical protein